MGTGQRRAAHLAVDAEDLGFHDVDLRRELPVPHLAHVEVVLGPVGVLEPVPAEEDVARGLHEPLPLDDPPPVVRVGALADVRLEHGRLRFLDLEEERIALVASEQQRDPAPGPDAADADDLAGDVDELELLEEVATIGLEAPAVVAEGSRSSSRSCSASASGMSSSSRTISGGSLDDPDLAVDAGPVSLANARRLSLLRALARFFWNRLSSASRALGRNCCVDVVLVEPGVPEVEVAAGRELAHRLPVRPHDAPHDSACGSCRRTREARAAISKLAARRFTSHSHGPGSVSSKSLTSNTIVRSGAAKPPKLTRCASPQIWARKPEVGGRREVGGHDRGRTAVERERRRRSCGRAGSGPARGRGSSPAPGAPRPGSGAIRADPNPRGSSGGLRRERCDPSRLVRRVLGARQRELTTCFLPSPAASNIAGVGDTAPSGVALPTYFTAPAPPGRWRSGSGRAECRFIVRLQLSLVETPLGGLHIESDAALTTCKAAPPTLVRRPPTRMPMRFSTPPSRSNNTWRLRTDRSTRSWKKSKPCDRESNRSRRTPDDSSARSAARPWTGSSVARVAAEVRRRRAYVGAAVERGTRSAITTATYRPAQDAITQHN